MWNPEEHQLLALIETLEGASSGSSSQIMLQRLSEYESHFNEFYNYLSFIFVKSNSNIQVKTVAGLTLKNKLIPHWNDVNPQYLDYCKLMILEALVHPDPMIRKISGSIITTAVGCGRIDRWPQVIPKLVELLSNPSTIMGAFWALEKICEDSASDLNIQDPLLVENLVQHILQYIQSDNEDVRALALKCINQFLSIRSDSIWRHFNDFMHMLYNLTNDPSPKVKKYVCQAFNHVAEMNPDAFIPVLGSVIEFMLLQTQTNDPDLALEAGDFWIILAEQDALHIHTQQYLSKIIPVLLKGMIYTEDDLFILESQFEDNAHVADKVEDIKPRFHKSKTHELEIEGPADESDENESDYDYDEEWNIRKCCAAALDMFSSVYGDDILPDLLPNVNAMLQHPDWLSKEAAILAIGAVAQGAGHGMQVHLPQLIPILLSFFQHEKPLIKSITCWTLGRFSSWMAMPPAPINLTVQSLQNHHQSYLIPFLRQSLNLCISNNKELQKSGCSSLANVLEDARETLIPYLDPIVSTLSACFPLYQKKNLLILYDAFGALAEATGEAFGQPKYVQQFMPPLLTKWQQVSDDDVDLFPLLECLTSIALSLGLNFLPFAQPIWQRSFNLVTRCMMHIQAYNNAPMDVAFPDKDYIIVNFDLLGAIVQALGVKCQEVVLANNDPNFFQLLANGMKDETFDVRSCSFALLGDLAGSNVQLIIPHLEGIMVQILENLQVGGSAASTSAMNNASWSCGEIAVRLSGEQMQPFAKPLLEKLIPLLLANDTARSLSENSAITIGRLGFCCPQIVAPYLDQFIQKWCTTLGDVSDNAEKASAYTGICKAISLNPSAVLPHFQYFVGAILKWDVSNYPELKKIFGQILSTFRTATGNQWIQTVQGFPVPMQQQLQQVYGL